MSISTPTAALIIHELIAKNLIPHFDLIEDPNGDYAKQAEVRGMDGQWAEACALEIFSELTAAARAGALHNDTDKLREMIRTNTVHVEPKFTGSLGVSVQALIPASGLPFDRL